MHPFTAQLLADDLRRQLLADAEQQRLLSLHRAARRAGRRTRRPKRQAQRLHTPLKAWIKQIR